MKVTTRRNQHQAATPKPKTAAALKPACAEAAVPLIVLPAPLSAASAFVIHPPGCRWKLVRTNEDEELRGRLEYAQVAIVALFQEGSFPQLVNDSKVNYSKLKRQVNDYLYEHFGHRDHDEAGPVVWVSRQTVMRALEVLRKVNR
jgi:hypothetical protein